MKRNTMLYFKARAFDFFCENKNLLRTVFFLLPIFLAIHNAIKRSKEKHIKRRKSSLATRTSLHQSVASRQWGPR